MSYLRALAINTLISDCYSYYLKNEKKPFLKRGSSVSLMEKEVEAQIEEILN